MNRNFDYFERAYFEGWLGKLLVAAFIGFCLYAITKTHIEPWTIQTLLSELVRANDSYLQ